MTLIQRFLYPISIGIALLFSGCGSKEESLRAKPNMRELDWSAKNMQQISDAFAEEYPNLERLFLSDNRINSLPVSMRNMSQLKEISLSNNSITQMPEVLGDIPNLEILDISRNLFSELPAAVLKLKHLKILDIRHNELKDLPEEIKSLGQLHTIYIYGNSFTSETRSRFREWMPKTKFVWFDPSSMMAEEEVKK